MARRPRLTATLRRQIIERENQRCTYCRSPMLVGIPMVIDHVIRLLSEELQRLRISALRVTAVTNLRVLEQKRGILTRDDRYHSFHPRQQQWHATISPGTPDGKHLEEV